MHFIKQLLLLTRGTPKNYGFNCMCCLKVFSQQVARKLMPCLTSLKGALLNLD